MDMSRTRTRVLAFMDMSRSARAASIWYTIDHMRCSNHVAPLQRLPCRPHSLCGRSGHRTRPHQPLSYQFGRTSPRRAPSRSSHMLHTHRSCRGGDHHRDGTRCCSRAGPALTAPLVLQSCAMMSSTLRPPPARPLDAARMRCGLRQHAQRRTAVSVGQSIGAMGSARLRSSHAYLACAHRLVQRRRSRGHVQLQW